MKRYYIIYDENLEIRYYSEISNNNSDMNISDIEILENRIESLIEDERIEDKEYFYQESSKREIERLRLIQI